MKQDVEQMMFLTSLSKHFITTAVKAEGQQSFRQLGLAFLGILYMAETM